MKDEGGGGCAKPDSTTNSVDEDRKPARQFAAGEDVLAIQKDGRFYFGTIVQLKNWSGNGEGGGDKRSYLVKFGDGTETWSEEHELSRLSTDAFEEADKEDAEEVEEEEDDEEDADDVSLSTVSKAPLRNRVLQCGKCHRHFRRKCGWPSPMMTSKHGQNDWRWDCKRCTRLSNTKQINGQSLTEKNGDVCVNGSISAGSIISSKCPENTSQNAASLSSVHRQLPYQLEALVWDTEHTMNTAQKYCYCGESGDWFFNMIQCCNCRQWFHQQCVSALISPLLLGDRFYIFLCSICNEGCELVTRVAMTWVEVTHLILFNLIACHAKPFYNLDDAILPYLNKHWPLLQLPPQMFSCNRADRRKAVLNALRNNLDRFKMITKKDRRPWWGLKDQAAPLPPVLHLSLTSADTPITRSWLENFFKDDKRVKLCPARNMFPEGGMDGRCNNKPPHMIKRREPTEAGLKLLRTAATRTKPLLLPKGVPATGHKVCIKSASPFYTERIEVEQRIEEQLLDMSEKPISDQVPENEEEDEDEYEEEEKNSCRRKTRFSALKNVQKTENGAIISISSSDDSKSCTSVDSGQGSELPLTPPPCPTRDGEKHSQSLDVMNGASGVETKSPIELGSGVRELLAGGHQAILREEVIRKQDIGAIGTSAPRISLPLVLAPMVMRTTKRRLSEKDIRINRNGEVVKRRRRQRRPAYPSFSTPVASSSTGWSSVSMPSNSVTSVSPRKCTCSASATSTASAEELKKLVYSYFGGGSSSTADNGLRFERSRLSGDEYRVCGKRVLLDGTVQYLVEWVKSNRPL